MIGKDGVALKLRGVRIIAMMVIVLVVLSAYILRLMRYQITDGDKYRKQSEKTTVESTEIVAPRGEVLDRFGRQLATNTIGYSVILEKAAFPSDKTGENDAILNLTQIFSSNAQSWEDSLPITGTAPYQFNGSDSEVKKLRNFLESIDKASTSKKDKQKQLVAWDESATADQIIAKLKTRYKLKTGYTQQQERTIIGVRYQMEMKGFSLSNTFTIATNVNLDTVTQISERSSTLKGVLISEQSTRSYPDGTIAPQVIGTVSPVFTDEYKTLKSKGYALDDVIGRSGIESTMEQYLRGKNGQQNVEINSQGEITGTTVTTQPQPGNNVVLTIDKDLQKVVQDELPVVIQQIRQKAQGNVLYGSTANAGAAVVLNIKTGEVLAMASYPSYDLNTYYQNYSSLANDSTKPLLNRCISGIYRPGSSYKPVVAVTGLMNGIITPSTTIKTEQYFVKGTYRGYDEAGGPSMDVEQALTVSSNYFFNTVADRLYTNNLFSKLEETAKALGLGQKTGVELPGELSGTISGPTEKKAKGLTWYPADAAQSGIGQLDNYYTPLQLAQYVGGLVNGGTRYQVHIVKDVKNYDNSKVVVDNEPKVISDIKIPDSVVQTIKEGMLRVTDQGEGTAASVFQGFPLKLGGKTGTAQVGSNYYNGVFVSFAPYDDPQIAVAVVIEHGHNGYQTAPIARDVFNYYFVNQQQFTTPQLPSSATTLPVSANQLLQ